MLFTPNIIFSKFIFLKLQIGSTREHGTNKWHKVDLEKSRTIIN